MINKIKVASVCTAVLLALSGCGSDDSSGGATRTLPSLDVPVAEATAANAVEAVDTIFETETLDSIGNLTLLAAGDTQNVGFDSLSFALKHLKTIKSVNTDVHALNETISETQPCTGGGSISISGTATQTSATVNMTASNCIEGDMTMNGTIGTTLTISSTGEISYMKMSFDTDYTAAGLLSMLIHGGSYMELSLDSMDPTTGLTSGTSTSSIWFEALGQNMRYDDLTIKFSDNGFGDGTECYRSGRIYINNLAAYMDIDSTYDANCLDPFTMSSYVLTSGSVQLLGSNGNTVLVEVVSPDTFLVTDDNGNTLTTNN